MLSPQRGNLMSAQGNALGINAKEHHEVQYQDFVLALHSTGPVGLPRTQRESTGFTAAASFG